VTGPLETEGHAPGLSSAPGEGAHQEAVPPPGLPPSERAGVDRSAALAAGAPGIPTNFIFWALGVVLVLSLGGLLGEHLFSAAGLNPTPTTAPTPTTVASETPASTPVPVSDRSLSAPLGAFLGLTRLRERAAPAFTLNSQSGRPVSLPVQPPRVVVLSFFDASCNDICPVLSSEIEQADADLGAAASQVEFLTVNTDPAALTPAAESPVLTETGLGAVTNWRMLTGSLSALNSVWKSYGVSISFDSKTGLEAHNDVVFFIDPRGMLRYRATPFADESSAGAFSLPRASTSRWALGLATYAEHLLAS
jgi:cytochrome oxidase Cu insertion factor (SCO1/SenC/PrrC family)